ncbi:MAG: Arc family DNA-binding protein [Pseudomonas sp.]|nr:Arc family DNA-binding protein [Pseudomonas sp.]
MTKPDLQVNFRMPADLKARLENASKENHRSLTSEVVARLEASFASDVQPAWAAPDLGDITTRPEPAELIQMMEAMQSSLMAIQKQIFSLREVVKDEKATPKE